MENICKNCKWRFEGSKWEVDFSSRPLSKEIIPVLYCCYYPTKIEINDENFCSKFQKKDDEK